MAATGQRWAFLTNHGRAIVCIARDPGIRIRDLGDCVGVTERAAHRIVTELVDAGYITRERAGRRNLYTVNAHLPLPDPVTGEHQVRIGGLLEMLTAVPDAPVRHDHRAGDRVSTAS